ncbi:ABC transporter substrate-binding protein [Marinomonas piezotolerans]|uniref:ABC transporter substrate-binding protein n=1 Tax=Marinomonas piezotolerans TaxID=2213058 RepID=A0A370UEG6_9GAMM|nr:ABC transporter substrate-binding protein [Marinomonas piezotolerans]RDL46176.1 ABC transporter substrate-binding protein [Marinomonas piezotolerans]
MIRFAIGLLFLLLGSGSQAVSKHYLPGTLEGSIHIWGVADYPVIEPLLQQFQKSVSDVDVHYWEFGTKELEARLRTYPDDMPDLVMSPAMDLQFKLVNDGFARTYQSSVTEALPNWTTWRNEIYAFAFEPIVMVINTDILGGIALPRSREQLLNLVREKGPLLQGKMGLSDIERVGLGYLTWFHDSQQSRTYGRLLEAFGSHHAQLYPNSREMLDALRKGEIFIAYNLVGSYALEWSRRYPWIEPIMPTDYTSVVLRTAFIPAQAQRAELGSEFLDYLLSEGQQYMAQNVGLIPIVEGIEGTNSQEALKRRSHGIFRPIPFGLPLLVQTDKAKRSIILDEWRAAMTSDHKSK